MNTEDFLKFAQAGGSESSKKSKRAQENSILFKIDRNKFKMKSRKIVKNKLITCQKLKLKNKKKLINKRGVVQTHQKTQCNFLMQYSTYKMH